MESLEELYKIGRGPFNSHTTRPQLAPKIFLEKYPHARSYEVTLYGSLAATSKGHMTDVAIIDVLGVNRKLEIVWKPRIFLPLHPNGMKLRASGDHQELLGSWVVYSVGDGALPEGKEDNDLFNAQDVYDLNTIKDITKWCEASSRSYWEYVAMCEDDDVWDYLMEYWDVMKAAVERGINHERVLPGPLNPRRKAPNYYVKATGYKRSLQTRGLVCAYALGVSEESASSGTIIAALTCGTSDIMPAVLYHLAKGHEFSDTRILHAMTTAELFDNVVKHNASTSGADVGYQGEVGVAYAMVVAATCQLFGSSTMQIEYAAEVGLEHHLGMTCDPVCGLVQIPCIERNTFAATRTLDANLYFSFSDGKHHMPLDKVVGVMKRTEHDLPSLYKETSERGLTAERF